MDGIRCGDGWLCGCLYGLFLSGWLHCFVRLHCRQGFRGGLLLRRYGYDPDNVGCQVFVGAGDVEAGVYGGLASGRTSGVAEEDDFRFRPFRLFDEVPGDDFSGEPREVVLDKEDDRWLFRDVLDSLAEGARNPESYLGRIPYEVEELFEPILVGYEKDCYHRYPV